MEQTISRVEYESWKREVVNNPTFKKFHGAIVNKRVHRLYKFVFWLLVLVTVIYLISSFFGLSWINTVVSNFKNMWINNTITP